MVFPTCNILFLLYIAIYIFFQKIFGTKTSFKSTNASTSNMLFNRYHNWNGVKFTYHFYNLSVEASFYGKIGWVLSTMLGNMPHGFSLNGWLLEFKSSSKNYTTNFQSIKCRMQIFSVTSFSDKSVTKFTYQEILLFRNSLPICNQPIKRTIFLPQSNILILNELIKSIDFL